MSVVRASMNRMRNTPQASNTLVESHLGSFFSHFGLQTGTLVLGLEGERGMSISSSVLVLLFSMASILNLFTKSNWGILYTKSSSTKESSSSEIESFKANKSSISSFYCSIINYLTSK